MEKQEKELQAEHRQKLLDALRSGKYHQGICALHPNSRSFCCLGVACDIYDPTRWSWTGYGDWEYSVRVDDTAVEVRTGTLPQAVQFYYGFVSGTCSFYGLRDREEVVVGASDLNDASMPFDQIADLIEYYYGGTQ